MSERIELIKMASFRGISEPLEIDLAGGRSLVVLGSNGSGKSAIADAIEFYFTGRIQTLAREGRFIVQHVGRDQAETLVEIKTDGPLGGQRTIGAGGPGDIPVTDPVETLILRGSTLAAFVDRPKQEKWNFLSSILGFSEIDQIRQDLFTARTLLERDFQNKKSLNDAAQRSLTSKCPDPSASALYGAIAASCEKAGVSPPPSLEAALSNDWKKTFADRESNVQKIATMRKVREDLRAAPRLSQLALVKPWNEALVTADTEKEARSRMMKAASTLLVEEDAQECPLCGQSVSTKTLKGRIQELLDDYQEASTKLEGPKRAAQRFCDLLSTAFTHRQVISDQAKQVALSLPPLPRSPVQTLEQCLKENQIVDLEVAQIALSAVEIWDKQAGESVDQALPAAAPEDAELVNLLQLIQVGEEWMAAERTFNSAEWCLTAGNKLYQGYLQRQREFIRVALEKISGRTAELFQILHPGEQLEQVAVETVGDKGVELSLQFYGKKQSPPHGVLSESHLNSLGIALFLAMAELLNRQLGFLVLDDVVNSLDADHRGRLAELLASDFEALQLIVLTHDPLFHQRLSTLGRNWIKREFTSWSYEHGPRTTTYLTGGLLEKAHLDLGTDSHAAATKGRRALEECLQGVCEGIGAPLAFRRGVSNDHREAGELIIGVRRQLKNSGVKSAELNELLTHLEADLQAVFNVEAHASLTSASRNEIQSALDRVSEFDRYWTCANCSSRVWAKGQTGFSSCRCGGTHFPPAKPAL